MPEASYDRLTPAQKKALDAAAVAMEMAYNPYSRFFVGAALITANGNVIVGSNVENAAYSAVICAERAALVGANARGFRSFDCLAIIARGESSPTTRVTGPCGACRQMLYELTQVSGRDLPILLSTTNKDQIVITTAQKLLPLAFSPADMGVDVSKYRR